MKQFYTFLAALFLFGCQGLNEPDPSKPELRPDPDPATAEITIKTPDVVLSDVEGSTTTAEFTATADWTIETIDTKATPDWFEVSPKSGNAGDITLSIKATKSNEDYDDRSAYIKIKSGDVTKTITVTQKPSNASYMEVTIDVAGTLSELLEGTDPSTITALRLRGVMGFKDFVTANILPNIEFLDIENIAIDEIPDYALNYCTLTSITLPTSIKRIGKEAFKGSEKLRSIHIPASVETIESDAFKGCSNLAIVTFEVGSKLKTLSAFYDCTSLTSITIPASIETIEADAFKSCPNLVSITFEAGSKLKTLSAFYNCTSLTSITIPASIETIEADAFKGCAKLASVTFEAGSKLKTIGGYYSNSVFSDCTSLTSITIPASVETIGASFKGCSKLANVTFEAGSKLKTIGGYYSNSAFSDCTSLTSITIPASVETIGYAFSGCSNLTSVTFEVGSKLKTLSDFSDCTSLTSITIPTSVETIGYAFSGCSNLTSVTFEVGSKLKTIGSVSSYGAFYNCTSLTSITIPASVETIEYYAFSGCSNLANVTFEAGSKLKTLGGFSFCTSLTSFTIPANVETIGAGAFRGCSNLSSITFEAGSKLKTISGDSAYGAFTYCTSLTSITIPASVETIGDGAFWGCISLTSITISASVETIGASAFRSCSNLASLTFEAGSKLKTISGFSDCTSLMTFDASKCELITMIGRPAFSGCVKLNLFKIGTVIPPTYDWGAFGSSSVLKVPAGSVNAYKAASGWENFATVTALD